MTTAPECAALLATRSVPPPIDNFEARCKQLRLFAWEYDARGVLCSGATFPASLQGLFTTERFLSLLGGAAARMVTLPEAVPEEISPGLWVIPILLRRRNRVCGICLVAGFDPIVCESTLLPEICAETGLSLCETKEALGPYLRDMRLCVTDLADTLTWMHGDLRAASATRGTMNEFSSNLSQAYEQVNFVFRLARYLNVVQDPLQLIHLLLSQVCEILPFSWVAVRFLAHRTFIPELGAGLLLHGQTPHAREIDHGSLELLNGWTDQEWTKILTPAESPLAAICGSEVLADPIYHDERVIGVLMVGNKTGNDPNLASTDVQLLDAIAHFFGVFHENIARFTEQRNLFFGSLHALTSAIDAKDHYTRGHSDRVGLLASQMARSMGMPEKAIEQYRIAGLVHDIGKIGVPEAVLRKAGPLTEEEFAEIKKHPLMGFEILKGIVPLEPILPGVLHHHERWDGDGYPRRLAGADIPVIARVLGLADTFDAMSSHRAYRSSRPRDVVFAEIRNNASAQFDPALVERFLALDFTEFDSLLARVQPHEWTGNRNLI